MTIQQSISLRPYNTFGIDVLAKEFAAFSSVTDLQQLLADRRDTTGDLLVLGGGSNILFTKNVDRLVLKNELSGIRIIKEDNSHVYVEAGAGENWNGFVEFCLQHDLAGVENLSLIPGSVGASPMQNIGAYGVEIKDVFHSLEALHIETGTIKLFTANDCAFGYRESVFKNVYTGQFIILSVTFRLNKNAEINTSYGAINSELERMGVKNPGIKDVSQAVINIRQSKLPDWHKIGNAGSFFKNPEVPASVFENLKAKFEHLVAFPLANGAYKLAAGWLIEQCGWKGYRKGDAGCYDKQALILVNYDSATGQEIYQLSADIIASVEEKFAVKLEREVNIL